MATRAASEARPGSLECEVLAAPLASALDRRRKRLIELPLLGHEPAGCSLEITHQGIELIPTRSEFGQGRPESLLERLPCGAHRLEAMALDIVPAVQIRILLASLLEQVRERGRGQTKPLARAESE